MAGLLRPLPWRYALPVASRKLDRIDPLQDVAGPPDQPAPTLTDSSPKEIRALRTFGAGTDSAQDTYEAQAAADYAVVRAFLARDPVASIELEKRLVCVPRIIGGLNRRMGGRLTADDLEDVSQDTALIVLRKLGLYSGAAPLEAWIYKICLNELRNVLRRKRRVSTVDLHEDAVVDDDANLAMLERRELVAAAMEQVRDLDAQTVRMHKLEGLTFVDIAEQLGVSVNTIKGRYYRGIEQMSELLSRLDGRRA